jgi:hypothetical protein
MSLRPLLIFVLAAALAGCEMTSPAPRLQLVEKGPYQALYGPDSRLQRLVYDADGDGRAEVVTLFAPTGKPLRSEIDTDNDGVVDRWEYFSTAGTLDRVGVSRRKDGKPDEWDVAGASGNVVRREFDEDGDGRVDRAEDVVGGVVVDEELDTDHDGRLDHRLIFGPGRRVVAIETDADGNGIWERKVPVRR